MTSCIAIVTNSGEYSIVLGSDKQSSVYNDKGKKFKGYYEVSKIFSGERWMMSYAGDYNSRAFFKLTRKLEGDKRYLRKKPLRRGSNDVRYETQGEIVRRAVDLYFKEGDNIDGSHFFEVYESSAEAMREDKDISELPHFILAANFDKRTRGLWYVDEFGNLRKPEDQQNFEETQKDFDYVAIGSGGETMESYIEKEAIDGNIEVRDIDIKTATEIVFSALDEASNKDQETGIFRDIAVLRRGKVIRYGGLYRDAFNEAEERVKRKILEDVVAE